MRKLTREFFRNQRGNVALVFALAAIPILGVSGVSVDYMRASHFRVLLQSAADASALASAAQNGNGKVKKTADAYMAASLPGGLKVNDVTYSVDVQSDSVTVSAEAEVPTTIGRMFMPKMKVNVSATASRGTPVRIVSISVANFNSDAWDANSIYWYVVPKGGGEPADSDLHLLLSNDPKHPAPVAPSSIEIGVDDKIGFALINVTGGVHGYGANSYGQPQGSVHKFYSEDTPENLRTTGNADCKSGTVEHAWDDNGGNKDDNDYNDAVYDFSCKTVQADPKTIVLLR